MMKRAFMALATFGGAMATALGAYGAHGLTKVAPPHLVESFNTAVMYQFFHCLLLMAVALWMRSNSSRLLAWAGSLVVLGILGFSGSIYALVLLGTKGIGMITPMGGILLMVGWMLMFAAVWRWERVS
ncbi:DUF423 domain-containing protein [Ferrimonas futtsuensis]|uniref:DUF423 domain-containing protein n=1 Tax=Ferrimonas futtsuensis TaxID=364764 RepID=UPI0004062107|nr:DUF423 domain-containing protein [Ferrimonas futtsuensis]